MANYTIISLKFSAGLYKELVLLQRKFTEEGHTAKLVLSNHYKKLGQSPNTIYAGNSKSLIDVLKDLFNISSIVNKVKSQLSKSNDDSKYLLFYNSHPINIVIQNKIKREFPKCKNVVCLHEPYVSKEERKKFGIIRANYIKLILKMQKLSISKADHIICFSPYAGRVFNKFFPKEIDKLISSNLLMKDPKKCQIKKTRKYFLMVGTVNKNKALDDFIKAINFQIEKKDKTLRFKILTSSNIDSYTSHLHKGWENYLEIESGRMLSDEEINDAIKESFGVLILHTTASQSGVIPLASSFGTPLLCRNISAFNQYQKHIENLLSVNFTEQELIDKCIYIKKYNNFMIERSNDLYEKNFSEKNFSEFYKRILTN